MIENGKLVVSAALFDRQEALRDATVMITSALGGGERLNMALRDDGANGDETTNDGVYSAQVAAPAELGGAGVAKISVNGAQWMLPVEVTPPARMTQVFLPLLLR